MVERQQVDIKAANDRSLRSLGRAIAFSAGQFSLVVVCCNYRALQERMLQQLQELALTPGEIGKLVLPENAVSLYTRIHSLVENEQPSALMVLGLESVEAIDDLLRAINHIRDEFRKRHPFPMVLWMNHDLVQKLVRLAPDLASWGATPIRFDMTTLELLVFLQQETNSLFATVLNPHGEQKQGYEVADHYCTLGQVWEHSHELHYAIRDLQNRGISLEPELHASLEFVFGLDNYVGDRIEPALTHFRESLQFWQQLSAEKQQEKNNKFKIPDAFKSQLDIVNSYASPLLRQGVLLFYIGLCYCRLGERTNPENLHYWQEAKSYFKQCLHVLQVAQRPDIIAQFINQLGEVLRHLQEWQELQVVAQKSLELHQTYGSQVQLACDYGFLAEAAVQELRWSQASQYARVSLWKLYEAQDNQDAYLCLFPLLLKQIYRLILAKAQRQGGEEQIAHEHLKAASEELVEALENSDHRYDAHRYIRLLRRVRSLYFEEGRYLEAFDVRQKRRSVEQQYGFRAFIGAGRLKPQRQAINPALITPVACGSVALEIIASGRERDISNLTGRIGRADQKLIVIHGPSGVGKSSTVTAGLVPALQNSAIGDQIAMPVVLQLYTDWVRELGKSFAVALANTKIDADVAVIEPPNSISEILQQLQENAENHIITVLIFDQFEEFFFGCTDQKKKQQFDSFICDCLQVPFVKIILSLREDYLHRLLEFKHLGNLEVINNNILDKNIRYQLNNFSIEDAKAVIYRLTERSQLHLEPALIDALVQDLASDIGEVRPIELQVVGAQLQDERITTLAQYERYRPNKLIERYIKELIKDCGPENERAALLVLYLLTDETQKRPFKTRAELASELAELENAEKLELILDILVRSGLVVLFPDVPERYQLIHDYLVDLIRYLQQQESGLQIQLNQLRNKVEESQAEISRLESELRQKKQQGKSPDSQPPQGLDLLTELKTLRKREEISRVEIEQLRSELKEKELTTQLAESREKQRQSEARLNRSLKIALTASVLAILGLTGSIFTAINSEIKTFSTSSEALFASQTGIDALKEGLKAGRKLQPVIWADSKTKEQVLTALYQAVYSVREYNRLEGHSLGVNSVSFSPNGSLIASASADNTIKLWRPNGRLVKTLEGEQGHKDVVSSVSFSPDGRTIASTSQDNTVKLWGSEGKYLQTLKGHNAFVNSVAWSPDGQIIASASSDKTVILWSRDGKLLQTLKGHDKPVLSVAWSPDGQIIASGSTDKTIKLWSREGQLIQTLKGHGDAVRSIAWSPDSQAVSKAMPGGLIASASLDTTIILWSRDGTLLKTLPGHSGGVTSVSFSHDGQTIASSSTDETVKLWNREGVLLGTLKGHSNWVNSVSFSPDGRTLASASRDKTIKLWRWDDVLMQNPKADDWVTSISFSPDGNMLASASSENITLWRRDGRPLPIPILKGHLGQVWGVSFSPNGQTIASASKDATVKLWSRDGKLLNTLKGHKDAVLGVAWSPDGKTIASASKDTTVNLWSREGKLLRTLKGHKEAVNWVSFSPDGQLIASGSDDNTVKLWRPNGIPIHTLREHSRRVYGVAWSPDSQTIASASLDSMVKLWNRDGKLLGTLMGDGDWFRSVSFSPDGQTIAASSDDKVRLWKRNGTLQITLKGHRDNKFTSIAFSPDGKTLATGSNNGRVILRNLSDIELENLLKYACDWIHNYLETNSKVTTSDRSLCPAR